MKKTLALILGLVMMFSFAACGGEGAGKTDDPEIEAARKDDQTVPVDADGYQLLYQYNGAKVFCNPTLEMNENGDLKIGIKIDANECTEGIAVELSDCTVNGFCVSCPSQVSILAGSEIETNLNIRTSAMAEYGLKNYKDVKTGFTVYTFNPETHQANEPAIAVITPVNLMSGQAAADTQISGLEAPIYDKDNVTVYSVLSENEFNSVMNLYIVNKTGKAITLVPTDLVLNGEKKDTDYSDYAISVAADASAFAAVPLPNYTVTVDEKTLATQKFDVNDYSLNFTVTQ